MTLNQNGTANGPIIFIAPVNGFSGQVSLSVSGLPSGVTAALSSSTFTSNGSATLTLSATSSASLVSAQSITVQATSGSITHSTTFNLSVIGPLGFTLSAPSSFTIYPGVQVSVPVSVTGQNGFNSTVSLAISGLPPGITASLTTLAGSAGGTTTFTLVAATTATASGPITFTGTSGALSATAQSALNLITTPDFSVTFPFSTYIYNGSAGQVPLQFTSYNGFNAPVSVTFGALPSGYSISPTSLTLTRGTQQNVAISIPFSSTTQAPFSIPVQATSGTLSHSYSWTIDVLQNKLSVSAPTTALSVHAGSSVSAAVSVSTLAGGETLGTMTLAPSSVPSGFSITPAQVTFNGAGGQTFYIQASSSAQNGTVTFQGTWDSQTATAPVPITVQAASVNVPTAVRSRNAYVRSDATADYSAFPPPNWSLYDATTARFFAADYGTSRLNVYDSVTEKQISSIPIPGAFGIGQASGKGTIYVGTLAGDIYLVDPVTMTVTQRILSSSIGTGGFAANAVYPRPDGSLLLERYFLLPGYSWVDGNNKFGLWYPSTNSFISLPGCTNGPATGVTFGFPTNNGARLLTMPQEISPTNLLCSEDLSTGAMVTLPVSSVTNFKTYLSTLALSPDTNTIAGYDGTNIVVLDAATLTVKNQFTGPTSNPFDATPSLLIGPDNQTLYLDGPDGGTHTLVYNMSTGQLTGWMPSVQVLAPAGYAPTAPFLQGISANGLLGGVMNQGFGFIDVNAINPLPVGSALGLAALSVASGPASGGTDTSWTLASQGAGTTSVPLGTAYFGANAASGLSINGNGMFYATTPAGAPGPVDVITTTTDGDEQLLPEGYSYGPFVLEAPTTYATAEGGGPAQVYGYGFGPAYVPTSGQIVAPPADLQILIGGASAQVTGYLPGPFSALSYFSLPFPLVGAEYTVPPGIAGLSQSINVSNSIGTTTSTQTLTYLPATKSYPLASSSLLDGIYDSTRDVYYFTDATQIQVFSRSSGQWLAPIPVPPPPYPYGPERLHALSLSPDHSKLVVSDSGSMAIDRIDLANGNQVQVFGLASSSPPPSNLDTMTPAGVAITNDGKMFFDIYDQNGDGGPFLYSVDPTTGKFTYYLGAGSPQSEGNTPWARLILSPDGQNVYLADEGAIYSVDTATGLHTNFCIACLYLTAGGYDIVLGSDGTTLFADGAFIDTQLNLHALQSLNVRESFDADYIYGAALSADNNLLFQPGTQFIDVFDTRTGSFLERVSLPQPLNSNYRALVADGKDDVLVTIPAAQGSGVSIVDLSALPAAVAVPYIAAPTTGPVPLRTTADPVSAPRARIATPLSRHYHSGLIPAAPAPAIPPNVSPQALSHLPQSATNSSR